MFYIWRTQKGGKTNVSAQQPKGEKLGDIKKVSFLFLIFPTLRGTVYLPSRRGAAALSIKGEGFKSSAVQTNKLSSCDLNNCVINSRHSSGASLEILSPQTLAGTPISKVFLVAPTSRHRLALSRRWKLYPFFWLMSRADRMTSRRRLLKRRHFLLPLKLCHGSSVSGGCMLYLPLSTPVNRSVTGSIPKNLTFAGSS